jgi:hypothetical protein
VARPESPNLILKKIVVQSGDQRLNQSIQHVEESFCPLYRSRVTSVSSTLRTVTLRILSLMIDLIWKVRGSANRVERTTGTERDLASTITDVIVLTITSRSSSVPIRSNEIS